MISNSLFSSVARLWAVAAVLMVPLLADANAGGVDAPSQQRLPPERAAARAVNQLASGAAGVELTHPYHRAVFSERGVHFSPRRGGPDWSWRFESLSTSAGAEIDARRSVAAERAPDGRVRYPRGPVVEQYVPRAGTVEQQFVLPALPELAGGDLVVSGSVRSEGAFAKTRQGWHWRDAEGAVTLGDVTVFDANGRLLPAQLRVAASSTRIEVDGKALAKAAYPVTIDPEIGTNDFRISQMGTDGDSAIGAASPAVAYNPTADEYLVVWEADDLVAGDIEIFGQRVDATDGSLLGARVQISDLGPAGNTTFAALDPDVAYNATNDEYLVVWEGDDFDAADEEFEIYGQRLVGSTGAETGADDFRISVVGTPGNIEQDAHCPRVAWDSTNNQYLVVWEADDTLDAFEIYGQLLAGATGSEVGTDDFRISDMGTLDTDTQFGGFRPDVVYNSSHDEYLVVWEGDDDTGLLVDGEFEIYGQRLNASNGAELGTNDFRISQMAADGDPLRGASNPAVAFDSTNLDYLVVWDADEVQVGEFEIYGQLLDAANGSEIGNDDFRISDMGPDGDPSFMALRPDVTYRSGEDQYLVVWDGDEASGEMEIYAQQLMGGSGAEIGINDERISDMGVDGNVLIDAFSAALASDAGATGYLVVWEGDDDTGALVNNEWEIYGQQYVPEPRGALLLAVGVGAVFCLAHRRPRGRDARG